MPYISYSENGDNPLTRLLGHNPEIMKNWLTLLASFTQDCLLDRQLQEEVRRFIAHQIGCTYCMSHGCPSLVIENPKTQLAIDFAKKVIQVQKQMTDQDISYLKPYFSDREIAELSAFICYGIGLARFRAVLNVDSSTG